MKPVLDCQEFLIGGLLKGKKYNCYKSPDEMIKGLFEIIEKEHKRGGKTYVYAHNMQYDFYALFRDKLKENFIVDFGNGKMIKYYSFVPFIAVYGIQKENNFETIAYFLDTMSFFRGYSLKIVGEIIGMNKYELPPNCQDLKLMETYLKRDCEIVYHSVMYIKKILKELGFKPRKIITSGNTAITCFMNYIKKKGYGYSLMKKGVVYKSSNINKVMDAYRGGRLECFKKGTFPNCYKIDCNSMYPYMMSIMEFPDLRKDMYVEGKKCEYYLNNIGVVKCTVETPDKLKIGYLPIRYKGMTYYPNDKKILTGTWTTLEIRKAIKLGYKIIEYKNGIFFNKMKINPFTKYINEMYEIRANSIGIKKEVVKILLNNLYGKFAQYRENKEIIIVERKNYTEYKDKGYKFVRTLSNKYLMEKIGEKRFPKYANPLISILTTAMARDYMYNLMMQIKTENMIYIATDCIIFKDEQMPKNIKIGNELGEFKIEDKGECEIYGENKYRFNYKTKISGIPKKEQRIEILRGEEKAKISKIITVKQALRNEKYRDKIGKFQWEELELYKQSKSDVILPDEIEEVCYKHGTIKE